MPVCFLEVPAGIRPDAKKMLVQKIKAAVNEVWPIPDVRVFFREYQAENVAQDGHFQSEPVRPVCFLNVPLLRSLDAKRKLSRTLQAAFAEAYAGLANTAEFMIFYNLYPLENASVGGRLQSDNPQAVEGIRQLNGTGT
jgi:hypothetical protein